MYKCLITDAFTLRHIHMYCTFKMFISFLDEVIDKNQSWGEVYPLGSVYHRQPSYPLTLHSVLNECSMNASAVDALQLETVMKLDRLEISDVSLFLPLSLFSLSHCLTCISLSLSPSPLSLP